MSIATPVPPQILNPAAVENAEKLMPAFEKMTKWLVAQSEAAQISIRDLFYRIVEDNQVPNSVNNPKNASTFVRQGKVYLDPQDMIHSVSHLYQVPQVRNFLEDVARCVCRPMPCSTADAGCDLGKPISETQNLLSGLYPIYRDRGIDGVLEPEIFLAKFIAAFFIFAEKSPFLIGKECTHFCESACTNDVQISSMEYAVEYIASLIGKTPETPHGLFTYLFVEPSAEAIAKNGHIKVRIIGTGPAAMQYAFDMRKEGYDVEMFEKEFHMVNGVKIPNFGGTWNNGVPNNKRSDDENMRYYDLSLQMGIKVTVAEIHKDISVEDFMSGADIIMNGAGLVAQPADLRTTKGEKDAAGNDVKGIHQAMTLLQSYNHFRTVDVNNSGLPPRDEDLLEMARQYSGQTWVITGAGYTEKDCTEWFSKFNHALKEAQLPEISIIVLERQSPDLYNVRSTHDGGWPNPPVTLETHLPAIVEGQLAGVERTSAVVIDSIEQLEGGKLKLKLSLRDLEKGHILLPKSDRKYTHREFVEVECHGLIKALGFKDTARNPSRLDIALGAADNSKSLTILDNRAKEPGVYYAGDNNTGDVRRASNSQTLVAAFADGKRAAVQSMLDREAGIIKNPEAWTSAREQSGLDLQRTSWLRLASTAPHVIDGEAEPASAARRA